MARRVFFSFHFDNDILRVGQIRNSGVVFGPGDTQSGFIDSASWEDVKRQGDAAIRRWIDNELNGTSVTVVLIGSETANRPWINYEIIESAKRGNGLLGIYIHNVKDLNGRTDVQGANPFAYLHWQNGTGATRHNISDVRLGVAVRPSEFADLDRASRQSGRPIALPQQKEAALAHSRGSPTSGPAAKVSFAPADLGRS